jgi:hypothetical protein
MRPQRFYLQFVNNKHNASFIGSYYHRTDEFEFNHTIRDFSLEIGYPMGYDFLNCSLHWEKILNMLVEVRGEAYITLNNGQEINYGFFRDEIMAKHVEYGNYMLPLKW